MPQDTLCKEILRMLPKRRPLRGVLQMLRLPQHEVTQTKPPPRRPERE